MSEADGKTLIHERVELAQSGDNPYVIAKVKSGWVVIGDVQPVEGYCVLLPDPVVESINDLSEEQRLQFSKDMYKVGDALMAVTDCYRINYEILGNSEQALHAHIFPRYIDESPEKKKGPVFCGYDWKTARKFDPSIDGQLVERMRIELRKYFD